MSLIATILLSAFIATAQKPASGPAADTGSAAADIARKTFEAHGGPKLKALKTLVVRGSVDVSVQTQVLPGGFSTVIAGEKYRIDIQTPFQSLKQTYDGSSTVSSVNGFMLPPITSLGFPLLPHFGEPGYIVSTIPDKKRSAKGFRITTPDGFYTDFFPDEKTGLIKAYESAYEVNGRTVTTSVEVNKYSVVEGITIPERYAQRFDLGQLTAYANFKAKEILVNSAIDSSVFSAEK